MISLTFDTGRCQLRPVSPADAGELHRLWISPGVRAVEVSRAILTYCYDTLDMRVVRASIDTPNAASARVLEKLGFEKLHRATVGGLDLVFFERVRLRGDASAGQARH